MLDTYKVCLGFKRSFKQKDYDLPEDIKELFNKYSENGRMSADLLQKFLTDVQGEKDASKEDASGLDLKAFESYLLDDLNSPLPLSSRVHHDMNAPLSHYFLYTGHNSYLTGNQLASRSSVEPIKKALRRGVRVIELDLWPECIGNHVKVRHGRTCTCPVDLEKCLDAIKKNAFIASKYPVVITFEDHLSPKLQAKVAKMVRKKIGKMLYSGESENALNFPSPESLKEKILISTKPPKEFKRVARKSRDKADEEAHLSEEDEEHAARAYRDLITIHAVKGKGGVKTLLGNDDRERATRMSMSEGELENLVKTQGTDVVRFTQHNLLRIYPKGTRMDSSNYDPMVGWMHGAQMVAFNMQGYGKWLWLMQGMFKANGGCGYVKKPDILLSVGRNNQVFDPKAAGQLDVKTTLKVRLYLGEGWKKDFSLTHFDRFSPPDFFVEIGIAGVPDDVASNKTKTIENSWVPVWNQDFEFRLKVPELALLWTKVNESDTASCRAFAGQTCLPVSELRTGVRAVRLHDEKGEMYKHARLLARFELHPPYKFQIS